MIYEIIDLLDMFTTWQNNSTVEHFIRILYDKGFELSRFREMVRSFKDCEKQLGPKNENRTEKNAFGRDGTIFKVEKITISRVIYKQSVAEVVLSQVWCKTNCRKASM